MNTLRSLALVAACAGLPSLAEAQSTAPMPGMDHSTMHHHPAPAAKPAAPAPKPPAKPKPKPRATPKVAPPSAPMDHSKMDHSKMDHSKMDHSKMAPPMDHSKMDHSKMAPAMDHSKMDHSKMAPNMDHSQMDHAGMDHATMQGSRAATDPPLTPIPALTDADRAAAFPDVAGHGAHDRGAHSFWLVDHLEARDVGGDAGAAWRATAWVGGDINRLWLRSEGESVHGRVERADVEVLGGRAISPWWDLLAGVRHDVGEGPSQTYAALGVSGVAPYKIDVEATAYLGTGGQSAARIEASYDMLFTNRWILQWQVEANLYGKSDPARGVGAGLSTLEAGLRLRYEVTRRFAPYIGLDWERAYGETADLRRADSGGASDVRVVAGIRLWF
jgi:copper resistance protein B